MKSVVTTVALAVLALTGCAEPDMWVKAGTTQVDYQKDSYECERDARMSAASFGGGLAGAMNAQGFYRRCMVAHGYTLQQANSNPSSIYGSGMMKCRAPDDDIKILTASACASAGGTVIGPYR